MRALIGTILCLLLTDCAYYGDLHSRAQPYTAPELNTKHRYQPNQSIQTTQWWRRFRDPELNQLVTIALSDSPTMQTAKARINALYNWQQVHMQTYGLASILVATRNDKKFHNLASFHHLLMAILIISPQQVLILIMNLTSGVKIAHE